MGLGTFPCPGAARCLLLGWCQSGRAARGQRMPEFHAPARAPTRTDSTWPTTRLHRSFGCALPNAASHSPYLHPFQPLAVSSMSEVGCSSGHWPAHGGVTDPLWMNNHCPRSPGGPPGSCLAHAGATRPTRRQPDPRPKGGPRRRGPLRQWGVVVALDLLCGHRQDLR